MSKERLFYTAEMSEVLQKEYTEATGHNPIFTDENECQTFTLYYIRWLEMRVYELEGRPQPLPPKEYCSGCKQMVHFEDPVSPWPMCPNCFNKDDPQSLTAPN